MSHMTRHWCSSTAILFHSIGGGCNNFCADIGS